MLGFRHQGCGSVDRLSQPARACQPLAGPRQQTEDDRDPSSAAAADRGRSIFTTTGVRSDKPPRRLAYAVDGTDVEAACQQLQRLMRDAEADIAEALSSRGWRLTVLGALHGIRAPPRPWPSSATVKDTSPPSARPRALVQGAGADGRGRALFAMEDALSGCCLHSCCLRVGDPGPWAGPWASTSPALRYRPASAVPPRSRRLTKPRAGCRASRQRCTGTRGPR